MPQGPEGHGAKVSTHPDRLRVFREVFVPDSASCKYDFYVICLKRQRGLSRACGLHKRYGKRYRKRYRKSDRKRDRKRDHKRDHNSYRKRDRENRTGDIFGDDSIDRGVNNDRM